MLKIGFSVLTMYSILVTSAIASPVKMQVPNLQELPSLIPNKEENQNRETKAPNACIKIENISCPFKIAAKEKNQLDARVRQIQLVIKEVINSSSFKNNEEIKVWTEGTVNNIYIQVGDSQPIRLMNVTAEDATIEEKVSQEQRAEQIVAQLREGLEVTQAQIQPDYLKEQGFKAISLAALTLLMTLAIIKAKSELKEVKSEPIDIDPDSAEKIETQLTRSQKSNLIEIKRTLLNIALGGTWIGASIIILGLFPQTIWLQKWVITAFRIPARLGLVSVLAYVSIRLSYALIARFNQALTTNSILLVGEENRRLQLRIATITKVTQGIVTLSFTIVGVLVGMASIGIDIAPILAGAGLIGLAVSFASQSIIKDTLNGFLIIAEDQYAVGDIINVGEYSGLVENINLRITQLRDAEGRLITIPNSEIRVVANLSSHWARADLNIPVAYNTDVDKALGTITEVAEKMTADSSWKEKILESPQILGVDNFSDRGAIVKVWIKTQPLQQWAVSREFRRRIKIAFDRAGIPIPMPQQQVWFQRDRNSHSVAIENSKEN
ncbi:MAG: mechanosensitive ion channel family protein [Prochloraceae cyanobacterium]